MREYKPVLVSLYDLLGEITKDGDIAHKYIEYDDEIYSWNGCEYIDGDDNSITNEIYLCDCKKPMIKLLDYVYDMDYMTVNIDTVGKLRDDNE